MHDPDAERVIARAACLRMSSAYRGPCRIDLVGGNGPSDPRLIAWVDAATEFSADGPRVRHAACLSPDPEMWARVVAGLEPGAMVAIRAPMPVLTDRSSWGYLRPHLMLAIAGEGCAILARGRWPSDGRGPRMELL